MSNLQLTIPAQDSDRASVKIKPREVHEWLDNLPYLDLARAARLASEQLRLINRQALSGTHRTEIIGDFLFTYHRLTESLPNNPNDGDPTRSLLKRLCQDLAFGYKIVVNELSGKRSGFRESRTLAQALLGSIYTLGLQLMHYQGNYQRAPRSLWSECLSLYNYAWQTNRENYSANLPGCGEQRIDATFRLIALLRLADPYQLPSGTLPILRSYFSMHSGLSSIENEEPLDNTSFELRDKYSGDEPDLDNSLFLDIEPLIEQMAEDTGKLERHKLAQAIGLPPEVPALPLLHTLRQVLEHWRTQPTRQTEREETHARLELVTGLDTGYCVVNKGRWFDPSLYLAPGHEEVIDIGAQPSLDLPIDQGEPDTLQCSSIDRSSGGLALRYRGKHPFHPRVGQLVAVRRSGTGSRAGWVIAVSRWLVEGESGQGFDLGLQYMAREPRPVVIRILDAAGLGGKFQPAIAALQKRGKERVHTLFTRGGEARVGDEITVYDQVGQHRGRCTELLESGPGFERLIYEPAAEPVNG
ncbi:MAG: hypothetical protein BMS9Abin09_0201 [Gammaproteobacteria bacterium]|nr:MAG: hypothetical protein BMS9Abin09_0201 [Gammaproteobacteria bacterium]